MDFRWESSAFSQIEFRHSIVFKLDGTKSKKKKEKSFSERHFGNRGNETLYRQEVSVMISHCLCRIYRQIESSKSPAMTGQKKKYLWEHMRWHARAQIWTATCLKSHLNCMYWLHMRSILGNNRTRACPRFRFLRCVKKNQKGIQFGRQYLKKMYSSSWKLVTKGDNKHTYMPCANKIKMVWMPSDSCFFLLVLQPNRSALGISSELVTEINLKMYSENTN